jgi:hypothetical protein
MDDIILCFNNIEVKDKVKWRRAVRMALESLPNKHLNKIPDIYVYNTMTKAIAETFNPEHQSIDDVGEEYLSNKVWGFSYLTNASERNKNIDKERFKRIVLAIKRHCPGYEMPTPEFTIFHEFGHFWLQSKGKVICRENEVKMEQECDEYALTCYCRLMDKHPFYVSISENDRNRGFEQMVSKMMSCVGSETGLKGEKLYSKAASVIMEKLKWNKNP